MPSGLSSGLPSGLSSGLPSGLYVHVPFCPRKCPYCDFYSISALDLIPAWLDSLAKEAKASAIGWPDGFDTLYIGGGSPSVLTAMELKDLFKALSPLGLVAPIELTIEANPQDVSPDKVSLWADVGLNRVSLGIQSFDPRWLNASLERVHTLGDNLAAIEAIEKGGLKLSIDLIYAHPGQEPEEIVGDLDRAANSGAEHISAYVLTPAPGTPLGQAVSAGRLRLPSERLVSEMFLLTGQALAIRGFEWYEVSNFARGGAVCQHNLKYWQRKPYLGLGPAAHSFDGRSRWSNISSVRRYISRINAGLKAYDMVEELSDAQARLEKIMLSLRLSQGLDADLIKPSSALEGFLRDGHLILENGFLKPTPKGLLI
ncbi:MAG: radical SAM family heme chaperone HemW, partial [Deltaproteobacteria bacterium]|nr:radical SAM family heme chaperone HemW [Deltaproteobacteria bacterium]